MVGNLQKDTLQKALNRAELSPAARRAMELRLDGAHAAAQSCSPCGIGCRMMTIRGCFRYHGASPGRFTTSDFRCKI